MKVRVYRKKIPSTDKYHQLAGWVYQPEGIIRGIVQVVHGMIEHIGRYDSFMRSIAAQGYVCFGFDNLGHGKTAYEDELGCFAHRDGYRVLCDDVYRFGNNIKKQYGSKLKYTLIGHCMGAFIVTCTASYYPDFCDKLITLGSRSTVKGAKGELALLKALEKAEGTKRRSKLADHLFSTNFNKHFADENDDLSWLSSIEETRSAFRADPSCMVGMSIGAIKDLIMLNIESNSKKTLENLRIDLPIMIASGSDDPLGNFGRDAVRIGNALERTGHTNVQVRLYEGGRHEILNDVCREKVISDILSFCEQGRKPLPVQNKNVSPVFATA